MKTNFLFLLLILAAFATGCSDDSSSSGAAGTSFTYAGPGSEWEMTRTGSTYSMTKTTSTGTLSISATGTDLSSGHIKLTVTGASATGDETAPSVGDVAHAVEVPGVAFLLKPIEANSETIAMIESGNCPTENFTANWVIGNRVTGQSDITDTSTDWMGSVLFDVTGESISFPDQYSLEDFTDQSPSGSQSIGSCSDGAITSSEDCGGTTANTQIYFTNSNLMIVATCMGTNDESHIIAAPQESITSASDLNGDYAGFAFFEDDNDTAALSATISSGTTITFNDHTGADLDTITSNIAVATISGTNSPFTGMISGTFNSCNSGDCEFSCNVTVDVDSSGKNLLYCIGQDPEDSTKRVTFLMIQDN